METANGRHISGGGEAPERPNHWAGAPVGLLPNVVSTPENAPSRGRALHHGSACD